MQLNSVANVSSDNLKLLCCIEKSSGFHIVYLKQNSSKYHNFWNSIAPNENL